MSKLRFCVKTWTGSIFLSGLTGIKILGKMGLRDQNNGKKIGINGSRIYHVTTLMKMTVKVMIMIMKTVTTMIVMQKTMMM